MAGKSGRNISNVPEKSLKKNILSWEGMLVVVFVLIVIFCRSISPNFHVTNVLREMPKYLAEGFIMLAMAYVLIIGEIDISVGAIVCLSSTWTCMVCNKGLPFGAVVLVCLLVGTVCGLINGLVLTKFTELPPMIVTLATQIIFRGIAEISLGSGGSISLTETDGFRAIAGKVGVVPYIFFLFAILAVIFAVVLAKTTFGRSVYAIGSNSTAAYFAGIPVQRIRLIIYTALGFMSGLAALFLTSVLYDAHSCPYMYLWNPIDVGSLAAYTSIALVNGDITGAEGDSFTAGDMGDYEVVDAGDDGTEIILGAPFKFDSSNIAEWKDVY